MDNSRIYARRSIGPQETGHYNSLHVPKVQQAEACVPKELLPQEPMPEVHAQEEQTEHGVCPPDKLKELTGDQEEPTAVTKVTKAPNMKPEVVRRMKRN